MAKIISVFDNEADLERALNAIGDQGINEDKYILVRASEYRTPAVPGGAGATVLPGAAPEGARHGVSADADMATQDTLSALSERLGDMVQNGDQLAYYANVVEHDGHLLAVRVPEQRLDELRSALKRAGATHIDTES